MPRIKPTINFRVGIGPVTVLQLAFFAAKIFGYIDWSWWLVFSPVLIVPAIYAAIIAGALFMLIVAFVVALVLS